MSTTIQTVYKVVSHWSSGHGFDPGRWFSAVARFEGWCVEYRIGVRSLPPDGSFLYAFRAEHQAADFAIDSCANLHAAILRCEAEIIDAYPTIMAYPVIANDLEVWWKKTHLIDLNKSQLSLSGAIWAPTGSVWCKWILPLDDILPIRHGVKEGDR